MNDRVMNQREDLFRIAAEHTSDTIIVVDLQGIVRYVSPSILNTTGYSPEEYSGMDAFGLIVEDDRERIRQSNARAVQTKTAVDVEYRVQRADGQIVHVETRVKPVMDEKGNMEYVVAVVRDVTERKTAEQLLQKILDSVNAVVWATDKDFSRHLYISDSMEKVSGILKEELLQKPIRIHDHIHPDDNEKMMVELKARLDAGLPISHTFRWIHEPEMRWGHMIVQPQRDASGAVERLDGIILDITEKKRSELALEESEQRYKSLFENNLDGVFSIDLEGFLFVNANRSFEEITGMRPDTLANQCFIGLISDEDHTPVNETLFEVMQSGEPRDIECRLAGGNRYGKIVSITFVPIFLSGKLNGIHGILKDITKRKQDEQELIRSEERSNFLQQSLNRFSHDLANVMKVSELENRVLEEVRTVLHAANASIVEVSSGNEVKPAGEHEIRVKIGDKKQPVYLRIEMDRPLLKIEKEWLETSVRHVTILYDNLHRIEDQMRRLEQMLSAKETPKWMLRLLFKLSEKERASLSSDLHDSVLQNLIIWYRKLESLRSAGTFEKQTRADLIQIEEGILDTIHQIRITCNELRPPFLLKMGLVESLKSLFTYTRMFANYEIGFSADNFEGPLNEEQILGMYRIVQELLNNANKHSKAAHVNISLTEHADHFQFAYSDDGVGTELSALEGSFQHMGIAGIEKRVLSLEGEVKVHSSPGQGFHVNIVFPKDQTER